MGINTLFSGKGAKKVVLTESEGVMPSLLPPRIRYWQFPEFLYIVALSIYYYQ